MKHLIYTLTLVVMFTSSNAQDVKTKDGIAIGKRSDFIKSCVKGANKKLMNFNGLEIETEKYCSCVCDNLIPQINSWEMQEAAKENKMYDFRANVTLELDTDQVQGFLFSAQAHLHWPSLVRKCRIKFPF